MLTLLHYAKLDLKDKQEMLYVYLNIAISMNIKPNDGTSYWIAKLAGFNRLDTQSVIQTSNATELLHATKNVLSLFVKSNNKSKQC